MSAFDVAKKYLKPAKDDDDVAPADIIATVIERDQPVAVLIDSHVIGKPVWFALAEGWKPEDNVKTPVFHPSELSALKTKTAEQLRKIYEVKAVFFGGGMVRQ